MHGRVKVRTTEEERERKKKHDELVMRAYRAAMAKIQAKREKGELDDEMLQLTAPILIRNPDITTLWNIRREVIACKVAYGLQSDDKKAALYEKELELTTQALTNNPKSYNCWHHRCWALEQNPAANWHNELKLCNAYLKLDERNFHTWDHRRYVAERAGVPKQDELRFSTDKISKNFSNYSSWHQRSLLLPALYPYVGDARPKRPMAEEQLRDELELVLSAAFTDPDDSSAWFYHRWLLGYSQSERAVCAFRSNGRHAVLAFTRHAPLSPSIDVKLVDAQGAEVLILDDWQVCNGGHVDAAWRFRLPDDASLHSEIIARATALQVQGETLPLRVCNDGVYYFKPPNQMTEYSTEVIAELQSQLATCRSLLEFEPNSKWALLTSALLMRAINAEEHHEQSLALLRQLETIDVLRIGYYRDLGSKWALEHALAIWSTSAAAPHKLSLLDIPQLRSLQYRQYFAIIDDLELPQSLPRDADLRTFNELS